MPIYNDDCLNVLRTLSEDSIDCLVSDPPYGISFMGKDWDKFNEISSPQGSFEKEKNFKKLPRNSSACMGEFFTPIWKECYRVMKPGAFGFIMCIPRQDCLSRMMISLEDAGFNINFTSLYWTYASGFPKALNIGKAIDKRAGVIKENNSEFKDTSLQKECNGTKSNARHKVCKICNKKLWSQDPCKCDWRNNIPIVDDAKRLDGSYGGFQPKPAVEVIIVVMKPLSEKTYVDQALENGKGVVWFDDCRIPYKENEELSDRKFNLPDLSRMYYKDNEIKEGMVVQGNTSFIKDKFVNEYNDSGRFPANLLVSDDVLDDGTIHKSCFGPSSKNEYKMSEGFMNDKYTDPKSRVGDSGSYSRFFSLDAWAEKCLPFLIVSKASKREKNEGCENIKDNYKQRYWAQPEGRSNPGSQISSFSTNNNHPTVKPIKLMSYLITLGSRPGDVILDPFAGSGTTGVASVLLDRDYICIEKDPEYFEILKARILHYEKEKQNKPLTI